MWNFCGFGLKRRHLIFTDFFSADFKSRHQKKNCLYYRKQQLKICYDKQLMQITVILRIKNSLKTYFVRDIKHLFYIIFCDFNFCGPELTAEYRRNYRLYGIICLIFFLFDNIICTENNQFYQRKSIFKISKFNTLQNF